MPATMGATGETAGEFGSGATMVDVHRREELLGFLGARRGHFRYESGHHGSLWLELDPIYLRAGPIRRLAVELARRISPHGVEAVCGPLIGGAFLAQWVAAELDVDFVYAERIAHPPGDGLFPVEYRIPDTLRPSVVGRRVAVVDDVINAGSATRGTVADLRAGGARTAAIGALLVLVDSATRFAADGGIPVESLSSLPSELWVPTDCPLCSSGVPLEGLVGPS
jgi:orotate phosphoribosyltransferase